MMKQTLLSLLPDLDLREQEPLSACTTFRVGGPARMLLYPRTVGELATILRTCVQFHETPLILGNGSNVLAPDEGLEQVVICTKNLADIALAGTTLTVGAGCTMARMATAALQAGLTGLEFAHGIPGTVGGGAVMNAGAYGGELKDVVTRVDCLTLSGEPVVKEGAALDFGYRHSCFEDGSLVIVSVTLCLQPGDPAQIKARMDELSAKRRTSQPLEYPSAGSTFKRPEGYFAARLIQDCDLKGCAVGGAMVSPKHAGFVINTGGATCRDILDLIAHIQQTVAARTGVQLELEVRLLGSHE